MSDTTLLKNTGKIVIKREIRIDTKYKAILINI